MPSKNYLLLKEKESSAYNSVVDASKTNSSTNVTLEKSPVSFSKESPLVKTSNGVATFHKIVFEKNETAKYLVFSAKNHVVGYLKNGYIVPEIEFFDKDGKKLKSIMVQFGEEAACQMGRCLISTFEISHFPAGKITSIVMARSDNPDKPFLSSRNGLNQFAGGVYLQQTYTENIYSDFFGDADIYLSNNKPLSSDVGSHRIFYQR
jgi:hypothetical protein